MDFGLGLILSLTDNATAGINNAVNSLNQLTQVAEGASHALDKMTSLSALTVVSNQLGSSFLKAGSSITGLFTNLLGKVRSTGSEFENFRVTLNALYGDAEKAENAISKLLDFSIKSPFEVDEVKDMLIVLQSQGIDAFSEVTGSIKGARQETLSWIADLMAFKPDEATSRWKRALTNYLGSGEDRMLRNILDMGDIEQILGHEMGSTVEERLNDIVEIVEKKNLDGLAEKLSLTWDGVASNIGDAFTKLYKSIADNGVFDNLKSSFMGLSGAILSLDNEQIEALGKTIADGLNVIITPITKVVGKVNEFIMGLVELCQTNPKLVKMGMVLVAVAGAILMFTGLMLKATSALSGVSLLLLTTNTSFGSIGTLLKTGVLKAMGVLIPFIATLGMLRFAWKNDIAGIKTNVTSFVSNLANSFKTAKDAVNGSVEDLTTTLNELRDRDDFFSGLTKGLMRVMGLFQILADAWNDNTISEELYEKMQALGLEPLVNAILDLKYRFEHFKDGFIAGWKEVGDKVSGFIGGMVKSVDGTIFESMFESVTNFFEKLADSDPEAWRDFGKIVGEVSANMTLAYIALKLFSGLAGKVAPIVGVFSGLSRVLGGVHDLLESGLQHIFKSNIQGIIPHIRIWFAGVQDAIIGAITGIATALGAPVWAVVAVIVAILASVFTYAVTHWEEFKGKIVSIWTNIKEEASEIWGALKEGLERIWENLKNAIRPVIDAFMDLKDKCVEIFDLVTQSDAFQSFVAIISSVGETITNILVSALNGAIDLFSTSLQGIWNIVVTVFNAIVNTISSVLTAVMDIIGGALDIIVGIFTGDLDLIFQGVGSIFTAILNVITTILTSVWNVVMSILTTIKNNFSTVLESVVNIVSGAFQGIFSTVGSILDAVFTKVDSVWGNISTAISTAINTARDAVKDGIEKIKGFFDFKWSLPKLKLPHFDISGEFSLDPPSVPHFSIDWYERGGIFDKPSVIGVGENGREAVMPLENNTGWISRLANMLSTEMSDIVPANSKRSSYGNTSKQGYLTTNNSNTNTVSNNTDNSVVFNEGAIQINVQSATEAEAHRLASTIMALIKRQQELDRMMSYA